MFLKIGMLILFFVVMASVGISCRKHATDVNSFVLGDVLSARGSLLLLTEHHTFRPLSLWAMPDNSGWKFGLASTWIGLGNAALGSLLAWWSWEEEPVL